MWRWISEKCISEKKLNYHFEGIWTPDFCSFQTDKPLSYSTCPTGIWSPDLFFSCIPLCCGNWVMSPAWSLALATRTALALCFCTRSSCDFVHNIAHVVALLILVYTCLGIHYCLEYTPHYMHTNSWKSTPSASTHMNSYMLICTDRTLQTIVGRWWRWCCSCERLVVDRLLCRSCPERMFHKNDIPDMTIEMTFPQLHWLKSSLPALDMCQNVPRRATYG